MEVDVMQRHPFYSSLLPDPVDALVRARALEASGLTRSKSEEAGRMEWKWDAIVVVISKWGSTSQTLRLSIGLRDALLRSSHSLRSSLPPRTIICSLHFLMAPTVHLPEERRAIEWPGETQSRRGQNVSCGRDCNAEHCRERDRKSLRCFRSTGTSTQPQQFSPPIAGT